MIILRMYNVPYSYSSTSRRQTNVLRADLADLQQEILDLKNEMTNTLDARLTAVETRLTRPQTFDTALEGVWARRDIDAVYALNNPNSRPRYIINTLFSIEVTPSTLKYWEIVGVDDSGGQGESEFMSRLGLETTMNNFLQVRKSTQIILKNVQVLQANQASIKSVLGEEITFNFDSEDEYEDTLTITVPGVLVSGSLDDPNDPPVFFPPDTTYTFVRQNPLSENYEYLENLYDTYDPD